MFVIDHVLVDLVTDHPEIELVNDRRNVREFCSGEDRAGGIVR